MGNRGYIVAYHAQEHTLTGKTKPSEVRLRVQELLRTSWDVAPNDARRALALAEEAIALTADAEDVEQKAEATLHAARALLYLSEYERSLELFYSSLNLSREVKSLDLEMKSLNSIGIVYNHLGHVEEAVAHYRQSLLLARQTRSLERQLAALNNIGEANSKLGNVEEAFAYFMEALEVADAIDDRWRGSVVRVNLGEAERQLGNLPEAHHHLTEGLRLARAVGDSVTESEALTYLGQLSQDQADPVSAERLHRESLEVADKIDSKPGRITASKNLAQCLLETGRETEALPLLQEAVAESEAIRSPLLVREAYPALGALLEKRGESIAALSAYKRYAELLEQIHSEELQRMLRALRIQFQTERRQSEAEIFRLRNVELREKSQQLELAYERLRVISETGQEITAALDINTLTDTVYRHINRLMDATVFGIALYEPEEGTIDYALFLDDGRPLEPVQTRADSQESVAAWAIRNRAVVWLNDVAEEHAQYSRRLRFMTAKKTQSVVYVPLELSDRVIGVITVQSYRKHAYTEHHVQTLKTLASYIAIALDNSRVHERVNQLNGIVLREKRQLEEAYAQITHMANHDNLTGLANRRLLSELLHEYLPLAHRMGRRLALMYVDLDDFKPINDQYGHQTGDHVLVEVARRLKSAVRASDTVGRIGGDEFIVVMQNLAERSVVEGVAEKIIRMVSEPIITDGREFELGASIGVSIFPDDGADHHELLRRADEAMYTAKTGGKRCVVFARGSSGGQSTG
jgi:diguanylate cyclase (GGDEF)-like protein